MTTEGNVMKIVPGVMSLGVLGESLKAIPKNPFKGKPSPKKLLKPMVNSITGIAFIGPVAQMSNTL